MKKIFATILALCLFSTPLLSYAEITNASSTSVSGAEVRAIIASLVQLRIKLTSLLRAYNQLIKDSKSVANNSSGSNSGSKEAASGLDQILQGLLGQGAGSNSASNGSGSDQNGRTSSASLQDNTPVGPPTPYNPGAIKKEIPAGAKKWTSKITSYYNGPGIEGGPVDERGKPLNLLPEFLNKTKLDVTIALDNALRSKGFPYGKVLRIPWFEENYNKGECIPFVVRDTGSAFMNRGKNPPDKIDVAWDKYHSQGPGSFTKDLEVVDDNCGAPNVFVPAP